MDLLLFVLLGISVLSLILQFVFRNKAPQQQVDVLPKLEQFSSSLTRLESNIKEDFKTNREESNKLAKENREELNSTLKDFKQELGQTLKSITEQNQQALEKLTNTVEQKLTQLTEKIETNATQNREKLAESIKQFSEGNTNALDRISNKVEEKLKGLTEQIIKDSGTQRDSIAQAFKGFQDVFTENVKSFNDLQKEKFTQLEAKQNELVRGTETKLDIIRATVEEKLEKTLSERLGQSFETVGKQLIEVQKGLGEMQTLAQDVGGLKKVLSNVKMRGGIGEVQLAMLLEQVLAPEQYEANVKTKKGSSEQVEFAIKLPGRDDGNSVVYLPVDAKFPKDVYEQLQTAYDHGDITHIETAQKNLETTIKKMAKDIHDKYIDPPNTTDFGIMFLPFEGIYAEVVRKAALLEELQRTYKIIVTGPTTLAAILNSLQMGFKTLAIQKRSSEVWKVLGAVKKEFESFGGLLDKAHKNITSAGNTIESLMGTRTRAIQRTLRGVESISATDANLILPSIDAEDNTDEELSDKL
ncbi:DNA recombination protein RmuC [Chitinophagaceae bacterium IBVUCB1]|nr:DNA recombination protein RmuC [Chitinophagaceae bacterium IBVUCB1]